MRCIYCLEDSSRSRGVPHVLPEALAQNDLVLPVGAVCDACNHYLGHELDTALAAHPVVSLLIPFLRLPGKRGKLRDRVGNVASDVHPGGITVPCAEPKITVAPDGSQSATVQPLLAPTFDLLRFRRALHHVGFNALVHRDGVERAYGGEYDEVRRYVRRPHKGESWSYGQYIDLARGIARDISIVRLQTPDSEFPILIVGKAAVFGVDLRNTGALATIVEREYPVGAEVVSANYRHTKTRATKGGSQYRFTIELNG